MTKKIFISRPLPQEVLNTAAHLGEITVRENTSAMSESEMIYSLANYDIVLPTLGDIYSEEIFKFTFYFCVCFKIQPQAQRKY